MYKKIIETFQRFMEVAPDKQMPSALIQFSHFLDMQARQLKFMLMSVRVQYEQQTNAAFPLE